MDRQMEHTGLTHTIKAFLTSKHKSDTDTDTDTRRMD